MKTTRTYLSGCTWCNASGFVNNPNGYSSLSLTITCPVCNGAKTIIVTETQETQDVSFTQEIDEIK